jgi:hypothetical protein
MKMLKIALLGIAIVLLFVVLNVLIAVIGWAIGMD